MGRIIRINSSPGKQLFVVPVSSSFTTILLLSSHLVLLLLLLLSSNRTFILCLVGSCCCSWWHGPSTMSLRVSPSAPVSPYANRVHTCALVGYHYRVCPSATTAAAGDYLLLSLVVLPSYPLPLKRRLDIEAPDLLTFRFRGIGSL